MKVRGIDLDKIAYGIRIAVIDDLIRDLENLKLKVKEIDKTAFAKKLTEIFK